MSNKTNVYRKKVYIYFYIIYLFIFPHSFLHAVHNINDFDSSLLIVLFFHLKLRFISSVKLKLLNFYPLYNVYLQRFWFPSSQIFIIEELSDENFKTREGFWARTLFWAPLKVCLYKWQYKILYCMHHHNDYGYVCF